MVNECSHKLWMQVHLGFRFGVGVQKEMKIWYIYMYNICLMGT